MAPDHPEGFLKLVQDAKSRIKEENFRDTKKRLDAGEKIIVVDTREDSEWARGHIPGAIHLGKGHHRARYRKDGSRQRSHSRPVLRRRISLRVGRRQSSENGLPQRDFHGRRLARLDRGQFSHHQGLAERVGWGGWTRTNTVLINSEVPYRLDHAPTL